MPKKGKNQNKEPDKAPELHKDLLTKDHFFISEALNFSGILLLID